MSKQNAENLCAALDAFASHDPPDLQFADPEVVFEPQLAALHGRYVGHDGIKRFFADARENLEVLEVDYPDVRDLGDRILAIGTFRVSGRGSGIETEVTFAIVATFRDGQMTHLKDFVDKDRALEAVGLRS